MTLNFVPDGKSKAMSKIEGKLDVAEQAKGKGPGKKEGKKDAAKEETVILPGALVRRATHVDCPARVRFIGLGRFIPLS